MALKNSLKNSLLLAHLVYQPKSLITLTNQYTQIDGVHPKIPHFKHILGCTLFKIPITHTKHVFVV